MSRRRTAALAWSSCAVTMLLVAATITLIVVSRTAQVSAFGFRGSALMFAATSSLVGALVASRRPGNTIGWLLCALGLTEAVVDFGAEYAVVAVLEHPGSLPGGEFMAWLASWLWLFVLGVGYVFVFLLFPDGHLLSPRWRMVGVIATVGTTVGALGFAFGAGPLNEAPWINNPYGLPGEEWPEVLTQAIPLVLLVVVPAATLSLIKKFRRSSGEARQQLKWLAFSGGLMACLLGAGTATFDPNDQRGFDLLETLLAISFALVPFSVGIAILRYRLYDIDRIISRTLAYGALTALLASIYLLSVLALQSLLPLDEDSPLIAAASTLGVIAAFGPLRNRVQNVVDRRFNRSRYDAAQTVENFGARLRTETNLNSLTDDLVAVTRRALQPTHVSLWLHSGIVPERNEQ